MPAADSPLNNDKSMGYNFGGQPARASSPPRPPVSPITPLARHAQPVPISAEDRIVPPLPQPQPVYIDRPQYVPFNETENTDAIALRSAISVLQIQKAKAKKDMKTLAELKDAALADPEGFVKELQAGRLKQSDERRDTLGALGPTLEGNSLNLNGERAEPVKERVIVDSFETMETESATPSPPQSATNSGFPPIPEPQNVFRCPAINWAKYNINGEYLDKLYEEQRIRPSLGDPSRERAPVHHMASPYSPFAGPVAPQAQAERKDSGGQSRKASKKPR